MRSCLRVLPLILAALLAVPALAADPAVPAPLAPWVPWVLEGQQSRDCPTIATSGVQCAWPTSLTLTLGETGGTFSASWQAYAKSELQVPGDATRFPQDLTVGGKPAPVRLVDGVPTVEVPAGQHTVTGRFLWDSLPESLRIPEATGLLQLSVRGQSVLQPHLEGASTLYLSQTDASATVEQDTLAVRVHRVVTDEIPLRVTTTVRLEVSGKGREVLLGRALLEGGVPMSVAGNLPARIEPDGRLRVQVRPGTWELELVERHAQPVEALARPAPGGPWTQEPEVWVWDARPSLRVVTVEGVPTIDPAQTTLPQQLRHLPTYSIEEGATFDVRVERRGDASPAPDRVTMERQLWLDFDGKAITASDTLRGTLSRSWRLDARPEVELGRVSINGNPQFITRVGDGAPGVEVREGSVTVTADSRLPITGGTIDAVGWQHDVQSLSAVLYVPAGFSLLHARGVDSVDTWVSSWTLLDIFLLVVIAFATGRLFGWKWGTLAFLAVGLNYHENDAPRLIWLTLLVIEALLRVLPKNAIAKALVWARWFAVAIFLVIALDYAITQVRQGIYTVLTQPQHDAGVPVAFATGALEAAQADTAQSVQTETAAPAQMRNFGEPSPEAGYENAPDVPIGKVIGGVLGGTSAGPLGSRGGSDASSSLEKKAKRSKATQAYYTDTVLQTGPGLPSWNHDSIALRFSGPVQQGQSISLWLVPPWANQLLAFVRVLLLALLGWLLIGVGRARFPRFLQPRVATGAAAMLLAFLAIGAPLEARAQPAGDFPSESLLQDLRSRLTARHACTPHCAEIPQMTIEASPGNLRARLRVSAVAPATVLLPGRRGMWEPTRVLLNGAPAPALGRNAQGNLVMVVPRGVHEVVLDGPLPERPSVSLSLPQTPRHVEARAEGWTLEGIFADGRISGDLQLTRAARATDPDGGEKLESSDLPPYLEVERSLSLGLDWMVETTVRRKTPVGRAVVASIPLLPGEAVTTADVRVAGGKVQMNLPANATSFSWSSRLGQADVLMLEAPQNVPWSEIWRIETGPVWHVEAAGLPPIHTSGTEPIRVPEYRPWQGESLKLSLVRPQGVGGQSITIDSAMLEVVPGQRTMSVTLDASFRASRGGQHAITLPEGATLERLRKDGSELPLRQEGRKIMVPLTPGQQQIQVIWNQAHGMGALFRTPTVDLGLPSVNAKVLLKVPEDRWVLFTNGPRMGPAVLFWGVFLVLLAVAFGLSRVRFAPLRAWEWLLLCVGLSQIPIVIAALIPAWLLAIGWRKHTPEVPRLLFNLRQLGLVGLTFFALVALAVAIHTGLLSSPEMEVVGNGSYGNHLNWYVDRVSGVLPIGTLLSAPILVYRLVMLAWALWIAASLIRWLRDGWAAFSEGGLWQPTPPPPLLARPAMAQARQGPPPAGPTPPGSASPPPTSPPPGSPSPGSDET